MRVGIVTPSMRGGGAEFVARTWANWLVSRGHFVAIFTTNEFERPHELDEEIVWFSPRRKGSHLETQRGLRRMHEKANLDVCVSLQTYPNLHLISNKLLTRREKRVPVVISERNLISIGKRVQGLSHRVKMGAARLIYRYADQVIAISHPVAADLIGGFSVRPSRMVVVPNPASAKLGVLSRSVSGSTAASESSESGNIVLVLPFRLVPQKRPLLAVDVANELSKRGHTVSIQVFGKGPLEDELRVYAEGHGISLRIMGWVENWFASCSPGAVVLLPSDREGLANVLIEAAGAGIPSVAYSGALGVADAVVPGVTGELVPIDSPADFADAVEAVHGRQMIGVENWLKRFSSDSSGDALVRALSFVISGK